MLGAGRYKLPMSIDNPLVVGFGKYVDKEIGLGAWFEPFSVEWKFNYSGVEKKGEY